MTRKRGKIKPKQKSESSHKSEDELLYCICRSSDGTRFMIACDNCEEWYHGDCINVTPKQANNIKKFFCHLCIGRNPGLEIEYKTIKETRPRAPNLRQQIKKINFSSDDENDADLSSSSTPDKSFASGKSKKSIRKRTRNSISEVTKSNIVPSATKKKRGRPREKQDDYDEEATEDEVETSGFAPPINDCNPIGIVDEPENANMFGNKKSNYGRHMRNNVDSKPCGTCDGCKASNCGKCDNCSKFPSGIGSKFSCRRKVCLRSRPSMYQYHSRYDEEIDTILDDRSFVRQNNTSDYDIREIRQRILNPEANRMQHSNQGQGLLNNNAGLVSRNNAGLGGTCLGSKMRRGDHLPGGNNHSRRGNNASISMNLKYYDDESTVSQQCGGIDMSNGGGVLSANYHQQHPNLVHRYHQPHYSSNNTISRLSKNSNQSNSIVPPHHPQNNNHSNRRVRSSNTDSSILNSNSNTPATLNIASGNMYEDSDEDVMIPSEYTTGASTRRHLSENDRHYLNLTPKSNRNHHVNTENFKQNYGLNYPDHLYCKHHRYLNWQQYGTNNMSVPVVNSISATAASSDLVASNKGGLVPLASTASTEEIIDFPSTNTPTGGPGTSPSTNIDDISATYMLLDPAATQPQSRSKYHNKHSSTANNCTNTNTTVIPSDPSFTVFSTATPPNMSIPADSSVYSIVDLNPTTNSTANSTPNHALTSAASIYTVVDTDKFSNNTNTQKSNAQNTSQEFYTINDDDSLEINWPKETVNAS